MLQKTTNLTKRQLIQLLLEDENLDDEVKIYYSEDDSLYTLEYEIVNDEASIYIDVKKGDEK